MTTEEYINLLRAKYGCQRQEWDRQLREVGGNNLQKQLMRLAAVPPDPKWIEARMKELDDSSPTDIADRDLMSMVELVKNFLVPSDRMKVADLYFTQLWTSTLNAIATRSPSGDKIVIVNRGCIVSFAYAAIAFTDCAISTPESEAGAFIRDSIQLFTASLELLGRSPIQST